MNGTLSSQAADATPTLEREFDLIVIGAGSGGVRCARIAASLGARVAIVERAHWGGTCVNLGCVPKKLMFYGVQVGKAIADGPAYGWDVTLPQHSWPDFKRSKDRVIERLDGIYVRLLENAGVALFRGDAALAGPRAGGGWRVEVGPSPLAPERPVTVIGAARVVVATGSSPTRLAIPGADLALTSDQVFTMDDCPASMLVLGAGYIGVEFSGVFAGFGVKTSLAFRRDHVLRGFDSQMVGRLEELMAQAGVTLYPGLEPVRIERASSGAGLVTHFANGTELEAGGVLMATGRHPAVAGLNLESAGVALERGRIVTNARFETSVPGIYAIGDVTNHINLTPVAVAEGQMLAETLYGPGPRDQRDFKAVPKAVFFQEPLSTVGISEDEALADGGNYAIFTSSFTPLSQSVPQRPGQALMKLIVKAGRSPDGALAGSGAIVGVHMVGEDSPDIIQVMAMAVVNQMTKAQLDRVLALHPTMAEEFVTMRAPQRFISAGKVVAD
ncbi:glutathione-disulfide reductase [Formicincola oecophyllae]|uniref:Glutathione-disulfide reductase n=2 Tax=Formicincola oecophyllae TaxID=2558361 RepID=A0A4Y6UBL1_9PROT|nr:glutathione-disulfide reductase [Formicincola oecophyllae]